VRAVIRPLGMELKDFHQLNGCETFSLIRFETTQLPVWFKAVGKPNLHEFPITVHSQDCFRNTCRPCSPRNPLATAG